MNEKPVFILRSATVLWGLTVKVASITYINIVSESPTYFFNLLAYGLLNKQLLRLSSSFESTVVFRSVLVLQSLLTSAFFPLQVSVSLLSVGYSDLCYPCMNPLAHLKRNLFT